MPRSPREIGYWEALCHAGETEPAGWRHRALGYYAWVCLGIYNEFRIRFAEDLGGSPATLIACDASWEGARRQLLAWLAANQYEEESALAALAS